MFAEARSAHTAAEWVPGWLLRPIVRRRASVDFILWPRITTGSRAIYGSIRIPVPTAISTRRPCVGNSSDVRHIHGYIYVRVYTTVRCETALRHRTAPTHRQSLQRRLSRGEVDGDTLVEFFLFALIFLCFSFRPFYDDFYIFPRERVITFNFFFNRFFTIIGSAANVQYEQSIIPNVGTESTVEILVRCTDDCLGKRVWKLWPILCGPRLPKLPVEMPPLTPVVDLWPAARSPCLVLAGQHRAQGNASDRWKSHAFIGPYS